jgi:lauroyl/myristoyl acyltransferase
MHPNIPQSDDLEAALAAARHPLRAPAMPPASLPIRLRTSPTLRRLIPTRLAVARAEARGEHHWRHNPASRQAAIRAMEAIVGATERASEVEQLAHRRMIEEEVQRTLFWQPWRTASIDPDSLERLQSALASGRGLIFSNCHMGPMHLHMSALGVRGVHTFAVSAPWFFEPPSHDYWGRRLAHWWKRLEEQRKHERVVYSPGSIPVLCALLEAREHLLIYFDMPGGRSTPFLGKPVMLATGTARLAIQTGAPIVPLRAKRVGASAWAEVGEALNPRAYNSAEELQDALAAAHGRWVLEQPETMEDPNRPGAWEGGASAAEWTRAGRERPGEEPRQALRAPSRAARS